RCDERNRGAPAETQRLCAAVDGDGLKALPRRLMRRHCSKFYFKSDRIVNLASRLLRIAAASTAFVLSFVLASVSPVRATTDVMWWHAMSGELGRQLEKLAAEFNASQTEYRIVPSYKGSYADTVSAAIFAFRSQSQPAIVQVSEVATATMMAAKGATYPVFELMRDQKEA